jgi:hypothetical protein
MGIEKYPYAGLRKPEHKKKKPKKGTKWEKREIEKHKKKKHPRKEPNKEKGRQRISMENFKSMHF